MLAIDEIRYQRRNICDGLEAGEGRERRSNEGMKNQVLFFSLLQDKSINNSSNNNNCNHFVEPVFHLLNHELVSLVALSSRFLPYLLFFSPPFVLEKMASYQFILYLIPAASLSLSLILLF